MAQFEICSKNAIAPQMEFAKVTGDESDERYRLGNITSLLLNLAVYPIFKTLKNYLSVIALGFAYSFIETRFHRFF